MLSNSIRRLLGLLAIVAVLALANPAPVALAASARPATPVRLRISSIALDQQILSVGLDKQRWPIVPKHAVGWYTLSARPGGSDNVVMWGHVLRWKASPRIPAAFEHLAEIKLKAVIHVSMSDGTVQRYRVMRIVVARPSEVAYILPTGKAQLTLVSCYGDTVMTKGGLTKEFRLITIATPIS
jgi:LPXTG-site transpeptidase (sortase) family protein